MASGAVAPPPPPLAGGRRVFGGRGVLLRRRLAATPMKDEPVISTNSGKEEMIAHSVNVARKASIPSVSSNISNRTPVTPTPLHPAEPSDLRFNRLRPSIEKSDCKYTRYFGRYVAREAIMDEEYWVLFLLLVENMQSLILCNNLKSSTSE
uniref:Uncharacterized protein n=2 Tax=Aegilops tauschii subsp. strangulata TaxID=200361 RepID=A0A453IW98_AEGTS